MRKLLILALSIIALGTSLPSFASQGKFLLGHVSIKEQNMAVELSDTIRGKLPRCKYSYNEGVTHVQFKVLKYPATIRRVEVHFQNGERQVISAPYRVAVGESSGWIDLRGNARCVEDVRIIGDTDTRNWNSDKQAQVLIFGKKVNRRN